MRISAFSILFISQLVLGAADCDMFSETKGNTAISRIMTGGTQPACVLAVSPSAAGNSYRRFSFGSDGQISIYVQTHAGSRGAAWFGFLVYPAFENPRVDSEGKQIILHNGSGQQWTFNSATALPAEVEGCEFDVNSTFTLSNGGVTMSKCPGKLVISVPIEIGGEYISHPNNPLTVRDPDGKSCAITTSDLYEYIERGANNTKDRAGRYYNISLKYRDKTAMGKFFKSKCPNLDNSMFRDRKAFDEAFDDLAPLDSE